MIGLMFFWLIIFKLAFNAEKWKLVIGTDASAPLFQRLVYIFKYILILFLFFLDTACTTLIPGSIPKLELPVDSFETCF